MSIVFYSICKELALWHLPSVVDETVHMLSSDSEDSRENDAQRELAANLEARRWNHLLSTTLIDTSC